jgi:hypothetical protein
MEPIQTPDFEAKKFTPGDVLDSLDVIVVELRRYKDEIGAEDEITPTPLVANKTPSDVYENIWRASYLLDGVAGHLDPNTVFRNVVAVQAEVGLIAAKLGVRIRSTALKPKPGKTPTDVNIEGFKNFHRVGRLQRLMGMDPLRPPSFPAGKVSPSDCYTRKIFSSLSLSESRSSSASRKSALRSRCHSTRDHPMFWQSSSLSARTWKPS